MMMDGKSNVSEGDVWVDEVGVERISIWIVDGVVVEWVQVSRVDEGLSVEGVVRVVPRQVIGLQRPEGNQINFSLDSSLS